MSAGFHSHCHLSLPFIAQTNTNTQILERVKPEAADVLTMIWLKK